MPSVTCTSCGANLNVHPEKMGAKGKCSKCGESIDLTPDSIREILSKENTPEEKRSNTPGDWYCLNCNERNQKGTVVCGKCGKQPPAPLLAKGTLGYRSSDSASPSASNSGVAILISVLGYLSILVGLATAVVGLYHSLPTEVVALGLSAALSGVLMLGFSSVIDSLAKIEQHLRRQ